MTGYDHTPTSARRRMIEDLLLRIESEFLANPELKMTAAEAERRFGADEVTCGAILDALVDGDVLLKTPDHVYVRYFPHTMAA